MTVAFGGRFAVLDTLRGLPDPVVIEPLRESEVEPAGRVLALAFRDNPLNVGVIDTRDAERRVKVNLHGVRALLPVACRFGVARVARCNGRIAGALIATRPYGYPLPPPAAWPRLRCWLGQGPRVTARWRRVFESLDPLHPTAPHAYLGTLGVDPALHAQGIGTALLGAWLGEVDEMPVPSYLETDRAENLAFYGRAGFEVVGELEVLGARVWRMQRPRRDATG
jgi:ribosomal protein S18 acetylase RimI-like enzyme